MNGFVIIITIVSIDENINPKIGKALGMYSTFKLHHLNALNKNRTHILKQEDSGWGTEGFEA